jgi:hypothetical protein
MSINYKSFRKSNNQTTLTMLKMGSTPRIKTFTKPNQKSFKASYIVPCNKTSVKDNNNYCLDTTRASTAATRMTTRSTIYKLPATNELTNNG